MVLKNPFSHFLCFSSHFSPVMMHNLVELVDYSKDHYEVHSIFGSLVGKRGGFSLQGLGMFVDRVGGGEFARKIYMEIGKGGKSWIIDDWIN